MTLPVRIRINAQFPFPSLVTSSGPVTITKQNGIWSVGFNISNLATLPFGTPSGNVQLLAYNTATNTFQQAALSTLLSNVPFTQTGSGAVAVTVDALYRNRIFTPEMFGAVSSPLGTAAGSIADSTAAVQAAINALAALGGGTLLFGPGAYAVTGVNITTNNIFIRGSGLNATTIVHKLSAPSSCFVFSAGASVLSNTGISDLAIGSNDTVFTKIAINVSDVSFFYVRNVNVAHYPVDGTLYRGSGGFGNALFIQGREHGVIENFQTYAEMPIHIAANPNSTISMDSWVFRNLVLVSNLPAQPGSYHLITIDAGVNLFNTTFDGHQNWVGGNDGLHWVDGGSTQLSTGLFVSGVKSEQSAASGASGYVVNIQHNTALENFKFDGFSGGDRALIKLRKVNSSNISNCYFDPTTGTGTNTVFLDIDSTDQIVNVRNALCTAVGGRATTLVSSGVSFVYNDGTLSGFSTAVPPNFTCTSSANLSQLNGASIDGQPWVSYAPVLSSEAGGALGTGNTLTGFYKQIGKTVHVAISVTYGAAGVGAATQFGVTIPVAAKRDCILVGKNRTTGLGINLDIGTLSLSRGLIQTTGGGAGGANSNVIIITGTYEAA